MAIKSTKIREGNADASFFGEQANALPQEARLQCTTLATENVMESLGAVYRFDAEAKKRGLAPEERLRFHQSNSAPVMDDLHQWLGNQFAEHKTEPNSGLNKAISYLLRHWPELTLFLRGEAGSQELTRHPDSLATD